ncbi:LNS2-domain-containing protein [Annulohypoxylon maeteangense]|uniref:LNS2-domain-containing protein n=1 Tax=Annulohypoxylon maeteangense TaxID=1927788 RepID=UPI002008E06A|nr:LNS2-domain-containing protein [Annulohypoxylon maeteangense]KAI0882297.1 LNS2-domain-containing protein [Annulohypoxylon maeteangense]
MQYVRNISDSVSTAWNSINPATLSGAIDVIVVQHEDGTLCCSPFHVRFGKFSLLRPYEKKVEFRVNGLKQNYAMKLGEGGEAFFVFETNDTIPQSLQTSPLSSPASSPPLGPDSSYSSNDLQEPEFLQLDGDARNSRSMSVSRPKPTVLPSQTPRPGVIEPLASSPELGGGRPPSRGWPNASTRPFYSDEVLPSTIQTYTDNDDSKEDENDPDSTLSLSQRSRSPPPLAPREAIQRALTLSKELEAVNIPSRVTETGDLMLDMTGYKSSEEDAIKAEILARKILAEELEGDYDIGALFGMDEEGNLWIYSSEDAKEAAMKSAVAALRPSPSIAIDAVSDPGYQSDDSTTSTQEPSHRRSESDFGHSSIQTPPTTPGSSSVGNPNRNYAKTLRLTSDQLKALNLKPGENSMSFTVNRATCQAYMYLWKYDTPVVISDIDGTITKSDALGHVLNMIGRDWTHAGVAKLYSDIVENGYNIMYLTSRSVGQSDTTRAYLYGITQDGYRLPKGPTILSPDRTMAALRREIYLRKPHVFKMATLRDIRSLYGPDNHCFYAGFGNRLTDQISYRTVDVPRTRIFTINSNAEVSLDLLSLNKLKLSYINMTEVVNHFFPPVSTLVKGGGVDFTDFTYWRDMPLELNEFSASESEGDAEESDVDEEEDEDVGHMGDSYLSRGDEDEEYEDPDNGDSILSGEYEGEENMMIEEDGSDADDEEGDEEGDLEEEEEDGDEVEDGKGTSATSYIPSSASKPVETVRDVGAELITGMKNIGIDKETKETTKA